MERVLGSAGRREGSISSRRTSRWRLRLQGVAGTLPSTRICGGYTAVTTGKSQIRSKGRLDYVWEVRGVTRRLEEGSVWPEEVEVGRNRRRTAPGSEKDRRKQHRLEARGVDSFGDDDEGGEAHLLVLSAWRGDGRSDGAMVVL
jgi:hypothetical protein